MGRHANISIFVPHLGCPHRCSFCDQRAITGQVALPTAEEVEAAVRRGIETGFGGAKTAEIAFFGGSFTAINRGEMLRLLDAACPFVRSGAVQGIRISTRPDAIDREVLGLLAARGVTAIELGAQSMEDEVLEKNRRGHTPRDVETAAAMIRACGFSLGLQMMTGLPGDSDAGALRTAERLIALQPETVRIYPLLVLRGTEVARLYEAGEYVPQSLEAAVSLCARLLGRFETAGVRVIRLGLHTVKEESLLAGPWHPAFSELCYGRRYLEAFAAAFAGREKGTYTLLVGPGERSKAAGQRRCNIVALEKGGWNVKIQESPAVVPGRFEMIKGRKPTCC
ncbi:MAG: elongator complex protein 3 [Candidatus Howiella sp.]|jgi:histone acetyltransferase (RNA polymerase elongator complex component)